MRARAYSAALALSALVGCGNEGAATSKPTPSTTILLDYHDRRDDISHSDGTAEPGRPDLDIVHAVVAKVGTEIQVRLTFAAAPNYMTMGVLVMPSNFEHQINAIGSSAGLRVAGSDGYPEAVGYTTLRGTHFTIVVPASKFPLPKRLQLHSFDRAALGDSSLHDYVPGGVMTADEFGPRFLRLGL